MPNVPALVIGLLTATLSLSTAASAQQRPLTPDELFKIEEVGEVAISPDARAIAYVHRRAIGGHKEFQQGFMQGNDRADIWLTDGPGSTPRKLTDGAKDGSGYWMPVWSPDGARLAMLSTKGGSVRVWVWHRSNGRLEPWSTRAVQMTPAPAFAWIDNTRLAAVLLAEGENPAQLTVERRAATVAMREWPKTWAGTETTASVLDSGLPPAIDSRPQGQLAILSGGSPQVVVSAYSLRDIRLSHDRRHLAVLTQVSILQPRADRLLPHGSSNRFGSEDRYALHLSDAGGRPVGVADPSIYVIPSTVQWSPEGQEVAFIGASAEDDTFSVYHTEVSGPARSIALPDVDPRAVLWTRSGSLLVSGERKIVEEGKERIRSDWWIMGGAAARNLTEAMKSAPADLLPERSGETFVGVADGDLWRVDPEAGTAVNLTSGFEPKIASVVWPAATAPRAEGFDQLVVGVQNNDVLDLHRVDLAAQQVAPFPRPSAMAVLAAYRPDAGLAIFTASEPTGTFLTAEQRGERHVLVSTNEFLRTIAKGQLKQIAYRSLEGEDLKAWVLYPPAYQEGARHPVVAWVYAGAMMRETPSILTRLNTSHPLNLQLLAARGYVVVMPSMPLAPERHASDPYMELPKGVLPALDKLIDMGVADPKRLAVMGQSYGGYSTYGLITLTSRFKAAVSLAGLNDLISLYGTFDMRSRYERHSHERLFSQSIAESGQVRMGNPPWKDAGRYLRNSPLFYVDRVQTPLLIIQGDMDYVALQQGEQFFTALYRQGKRARFVRYWGEGHVFSSPANIRDMWKQILGWLDEFLAPAATNEKTQ